MIIKQTERLLVNFKQTIQSSFVRNILVVASGTAVAQGIAFLFSPILSRLYKPEQFGTLALYTTIVSLMVAVSALGYESAIVLPRKKEEGGQLLMLSILLAVVVFLLSVLVLLTLQGFILQNLKVPDRERFYFILLPLVVLVNTVATAMTYWNNRLVLYKINSAFKVALSLGVAIGSLTFGQFFPSTNGLIVAFVVANILFSAIFIIVSWRATRLNDVKQTRTALLERARQYDQFPKYNLIPTFFDALRENVFVIIIQSAFSATILGSYAFALRIIRMPLNLISASISQVAYQKISTLKNENSEVRTFIFQLVALLGIISIPLALIFIFFGPQLFVFVFGEPWEDAGHYTRFLAVWIFCNFISSPLSTIPLIYNRTKWSFYYSVCFNIISMGTFYLCVRFSNQFELSLFVTSVVSGLYLIFYMIQIIAMVNRHHT